MTRAAPRHDAQRWECGCDSDNPVLLGIVANGALAIKGPSQGKGRYVQWVWISGDAAVTTTCRRCGVASTLVLTSRKEQAA